MKRILLALLFIAATALIASDRGERPNLWECSNASCAQTPDSAAAPLEIPLDDFPQSVKGYRLQLAPCSAESLAVQLAKRINQQTNMAAHLRYEAGLWRVHLGDFRSKSEAQEALKRRILPLGYRDAQVVSEQIPLPPAERQPPQHIAGFRLQVKALSDSNRALELGRYLDSLFPEVRAYVVKQDSLYKVQIGDFKKREAAEKFQARLRHLPDLDIWLVSTQVHSEPKLLRFTPPKSEAFKYDE